MPQRSHEVLVTAVDEFDRRVNVRDIPRRQIEDGRVDLKIDTASTRQVPQNRAETVACACEWIDDSDGTGADRWQYDLGNVSSDLVSERVLDRL